MSQSTEQDQRVKDISLGRKHKIQLSVVSEESGFRSLVISHVQQKSRLVVSESTIDLLRRKIGEWAQESSSSGPEYIRFRDRNVLKLERLQGPDGQAYVSLVDLSGAEGSEAVSFPADKLGVFFDALFDPLLQHPSGCLEKVVSYHRMAQLAFPGVSESLNGEMGFRTGFLCLDIKNPEKSQLSGDSESVFLGGLEKGRSTSADAKKVLKLKDFKSRLGAKRKSVTSVNYDDFLSQEAGPKGADERPHEVAKKKHSEVIDLGLPATRVKGAAEFPLRIKPDETDLQELRECVLSQKGNWEFYLGFEIVDCFYRDRSKKLRCFRFPLYFLPVKLSDSGSEIEISPSEGKWAVLNFLALATLATRFSRSKARNSQVERLFQRLLHSRFELGGMGSRPHLLRRLPISEKFFSEQRRLIFGQEEQGPVEGIFDNLTVKHVSFDLNRSLLFSRQTELSAKDEALQLDLKSTYAEALEDHSSYYSSLLGRIFSPERGLTPEQANSPQRTRSRFNPFEVSANAFRLFSEVDQKDVLLVEGPPGTGKTYSMLNLLVHCVCHGESVLVVSDKQSALDALYEKIVDFACSNPTDDVDSSFRSFALGVGIKKLSFDDSKLLKLQTVASQLREQLRLDLFSTEHIGLQTSDAKTVSAQLSDIDKEISEELRQIDRKLSRQFDRSSRKSRVCPRNWHESSTPDIESLVNFVSYLMRSPEVPQSELFRRLKNFVRNREKILFPLYPGLADALCPPHYRQVPGHLQQLHLVQTTVSALIQRRPRTEGAFLKEIQALEDTPWHRFLQERFRKAFLRREHSRLSGLSKLKDKLVYPLLEDLQNLRTILVDDCELLELGEFLKKHSATQMTKLHRFLEHSELQEYCLIWNLIDAMFLRAGVVGGVGAGGGAEKGLICDHLSRIDVLRQERSKVVQSQFLQELALSKKRVESLFLNNKSHAVDSFAEVDSLFESVATADSKEAAQRSFEKLKKLLQKVFRVWLLRKDQVSLLLPRARNSFDVVIIDEATQCRVDDAIPVLARAKKVIAVGDDKQTVLQRVSPIDDYLFHDLELEEHLERVGATGVKAGGSHIFGLVKGLKQARILLDEHYRCPPEIIEFSNHYVYADQLKIMQWKPKGSPPAVVVDHTEKRTRIRNRPTSGKYKGVEKSMIDRFFGFVERSILAFEAESGRKVNLNTDVAICYFLLKNQEYVQEAKAHFLRRMNRGNELLDGAGAALQGKERDLIFYLWDITKANYVAFLQGDDPTKRKGELNVLMSRPKLRAYHYLHKDFASLNHSRSSIASFLWETLHRNSGKAKLDASDVVYLRQQAPDPRHVPWKRGDGHLLYELLKRVFAVNGLSREFARYEPQFGVAVARVDRRVDLILNEKRGAGHTIRGEPKRVAIVELSGFEQQANADQLCQYAAVLTRAKPSLTPLFIHLQELFIPGSSAFRRIRESLVTRERAFSEGDD